MTDAFTFAATLNPINFINNLTGQPGSGEIIIILALLIGVVGTGLLIQIHRATRGLTTNMWRAYRSGKTLCFIPFVDGLLYTDVLTVDKVKDGRYRFKDRYSWFIDPKGKAIWAAGIEYTILVPDLMINMTLNQMASWLKKKTIAQQFIWNNDKGEPVTDIPIEEIKKILYDASRIPSAAEADTEISQIANIITESQAQPDEGQEKFWKYIIIAGVIVLAIAVIMTSNHTITIDYAQPVAKAVVNATKVMP